ncbi:GIY-YIG nuclease family protein [Patescibacteria group bacterium]|nr:MAG: GIY-YIG nuclease family protein [Patescibacteria group bacterium]
MAFVYILKTNSGKYYIGSTGNLEARLQHHRSGHTLTTKRLGFGALVFSQKYVTLAEARYIERRLKKLKRRDYIEKIIQNGFIGILPP